MPSMIRNSREFAVQPLDGTRHTLAKRVTHAGAGRHIGLAYGGRSPETVAETAAETAGKETPSGQTAGKCRLEVKSAPGEACP